MVVGGRKVVCERRRASTASTSLFPSTTTTAAALTTLITLSVKSFRCIYARNRNRIARKLLEVRRSKSSRVFGLRLVRYFFKKFYSITVLLHTESQLVYGAP